MTWSGATTATASRLALAVAGDRAIAVRAGAGAGLVAFAHDDGLALVREVSPTTLNLGLLLGAFAVAALVVAGIVLLAGRVLACRSAGLPRP